MEWTRKKRYLPYEKWSAMSLLKLQAQTANSPFLPHYHIHPTSGLLNDPNGFSYFNGKYHVFYQAYPFGAVHGLKSWFHAQAADLVHWRNLGLAIAPNKKMGAADSHGAYSGSARVINDRLFLMYTGNHRDANWHRTPYQLGAWMNARGQIKKIDTPLFKNPAHITDNFRDPQLLQKNSDYYALLGAQDKQKKEGHIDVWRSPDLKQWHEVGFLNFTHQPLGYMVECPNVVQVDGQPVVIFCPQGLSHKIVSYQNIDPNVYVIGKKLDLTHHQLTGSGPITNFDDGFDIYATQAFNAPNGQTYVISWIGLPDTTYPTDKENWANCLSQVKKLHIVNNHLIQQPVPAMASLRQQEHSLNKQQLISRNAGQQYELKLELAPNQEGQLMLAANHSLKQGLKLIFDTKRGKFTLDRGQAGQEVSPAYGTQRSVSLPNGKLLQLDIFIDHSIIEIFVNHGRHVLTARYFANANHCRIAFTTNIKYKGSLWSLTSI